jgi:hypothetical protein
MNLNTVSFKGLGRQGQQKNTKSEHEKVMACKLSSMSNTLQQFAKENVAPDHFKSPIK